MSGFMFLGAGALGYAEGYWALWYAAGDIGGGVVNLSAIGRRMRKLSQLTGSLTPIEYLEKRYPSPAIRLFAGVLTVFLLGAYVLAQFIAGGKGMALVTGMPYSLTLLVAVGFILIYTYVGGYLAVAYTDFFQSLVMLVGVLWILVAALMEVGGLSAANRAIADLEPSLLSIWGRDLRYQGQWGIALGAVLIFSIGYMGWPHVVTRHMAMRCPATARLAGAYATGWNLLFVPSPYLVGILAIIIVPDLADPEMAIFEVAEKLLPAAATGIVMAAIMAAIMSTADSLLLQTGSIAARDLYERFINPNASEHQMVWVSRLMVLAIGVIGYFIALIQPPTVFGIVIFVTSVLGSAFLPAYVCAVWWLAASQRPRSARLDGGGRRSSLPVAVGWSGRGNRPSRHAGWAPELDRDHDPRQSGNAESGSGASENPRVADRSGAPGGDTARRYSTFNRRATRGAGAACRSGLA